MQLRLTVRLVKLLLKKHPRQNLAESVKWMDDDRTQEYEIETFKPTELETLRELCLERPTEPGAPTAAKKIASYFLILQCPEGKTVKTLEEWPAILREYLKKGHKHWIFTDKDEEFMLPYYVCNIQYHPAQKNRDHYTPAYVSMTGLALHRGTRVKEQWDWHHHDVVGKTVPDVLDNDRIFFPMEELVKDYDVTLAKYLDMQPQTGQQYTGIGACEMGSERDRWGYSTSSEGSLVKDGVPAKLVMDDKHEEGGEFGNDSGISSNKFWQTGEEVTEDDEGEEDDSIALPVHPYVKLFNLDEHEFIVAHSDQLTPYKWTPELGDKLILPAGAKEIITVLMDTASETLDDIVKGKSGGTIVICTGPPGCGKTLTAEVTSEVIKRPLYKVQCSQMGTDEEEIEKELKMILTRAERWQALLLIDEADVYVRTREKDIQQNAIVGVFLRVLEYYRGVLFLTTNMPGAIDDAIMSRATAHLKYVLPTKNELASIWMVLAEQFGIEIQSKTAVIWANAFADMTGRDVKSLLKLAIRFARNRKCEVTLDVLKKLAPHKDIKLSGY